MEFSSLKSEVAARKPSSRRYTGHGPDSSSIREWWGVSFLVGCSWGDGSPACPKGNPAYPRRGGGAQGWGVPLIMVAVLYLLKLSIFYNLSSGKCKDFVPRERRLT